MEKPLIKPRNPKFSSGPCAKNPTWSLSALSNAFISRGHRSVAGQQRIAEVLNKITTLLELPAGYKVFLTPGSATGAITIAMWNFLGQRPVDVLAWDVFGKRWAKDVAALPLAFSIHEVPFGADPDFSKVNKASDVLFVWGATSTGASVGDLAWLDSQKQEGLVVCDATSSAFGVALPWEKLDVTCFSWQKIMGSEAGHGVMVLSPKAITSIETYSPVWPVPYLLNLKPDGRLRSSLFEGDVINTPSMLCLEDFLQSLIWAEQSGGAKYLINRTETNYQTVQLWINNSSWAENLVSNPLYHSKTTACIRLKYDNEFLTDEQVLRLTRRLADEQVAFDIKGFKGVPSNIRIWTGPTIEPEDLSALLSWVDWAYNEKVFL